MAGNFNFIFPRDLSEEKQWMTFRISEIKKLGITSDTFALEATNIKLPVPSNLKDNTHVYYNANKLGSVAGQFVQNVRSGTNLLTAEMAAAAVVSSGAAAGKSLALAMAGSAAGDSAIAITKGGIQALGAASGIAINPFMTVMFERPEFRVHNFSWRLTPRNNDESNELLSIVKAFKIAMLPGLVRHLGNVVLTYPYVLTITLSNANLNAAYNFKTSVIESFNINYAPTGYPSFFRGTQQPTIVDMSLNLKEIEYNTRESYGATTSDLSLFGLLNDNNSPEFRQKSAAAIAQADAAAIAQAGGGGPAGGR